MEHYELTRLERREIAFALDTPIQHVGPLLVAESVEMEGNK